MYSAVRLGAVQLNSAVLFTSAERRVQCIVLCKVQWEQDDVVRKLVKIQEFPKRLENTLKRIRGFRRKLGQISLLLYTGITTGKFCLL